MPTNLYGPNDNFDLNSSHVLPALIRKFHDAKVNAAPEVEIWGTGSPMREFLHVDDLADACLFLMEHYEEKGHINVGTGEDLSIRALASSFATSCTRGPSWCLTRASPMACPASCSTSPSSARSAGRPRSAWKTASAPLTSGSSTH